MRLISEEGGVEGGYGSFAPFVAEAASGAVEGLLEVVDGEHTEDYWSVAQGVEYGYPLGGVLADVVEVGGVAAYHTADDDDC